MIAQELHRAVASFINPISHFTTSRDANVQHLNLFQLYNYCLTVLEFCLQSWNSCIPDHIDSYPTLDWISKSYFLSKLGSSSRFEGIIPFQSVALISIFVVTNTLEIGKRTSFWAIIILPLYLNYPPSPIHEQNKLTTFWATSSSSSTILVLKKTQIHCWMKLIETSSVIAKEAQPWCLPAASSWPHTKS